MPQLIKKLADMMLNSPFEVAAIEMSPQFHLKFVHELLHDHEGNKDIALGMNGLSFMNLPILFVHGPDDYFRVINSDLHRLRLNHTNLLGIYNEKYTRLKVFISNGYKIENSNSAQFSQTAELQSLVYRLNQIEGQMKTISQEVYKIQT
jgi:hypothetical protein